MRYALTIAVALYGISVHVAITVFAFRLLFDPERLRIAPATFWLDARRYIRALLYETFAWPHALYRALASL